MWIFLNDSFVSAVQHRLDPSLLMVRARIRGDLDRLFPGGIVVETPRADYRFRVVVKRTDFAKVVAQEISRIDYANFKDSVKDRARHDAYMDVWSVMWREQNRSRDREADASDWPDSAY